MGITVFSDGIQIRTTEEQDYKRTAVYLRHIDTASILFLQI